MKKQFCSHKISSDLRELGFDEECLAYWKKNEIILYSSKSEITQKVIFDNYGGIKAPLYQQVIDWFREKYRLIIRDDTPTDMTCSYDPLEKHFEWIVIRVGEDRTTNALRYTSHEGKSYSSYYEAREQAILKALELCQKEK